MKRLFWLVLLFPLLAIAQVQKCSIDGKTVYSDSLCGQTGVAVNVDPNSLDTSGMRDLAVQCEAKVEQDKAKAAAANVRPRGGAPGPCDGIITLGKQPTERQRSEYQRCQDKQLREYRRQ